MIPYLKLDTVVPGATPSDISPDELDKSIGYIPGWKALLDPDYLVGGGVLNRASGGVINPPTPWTSSNIGILPNGKTAFRISTNTNNRLISDVSINPTAWSVFFLINETSVSPSGSRDLIAPEVLTGAGIALRVAIRTTRQISIYPTAATTPRLTVAASAVPASQTFLLMCTGSVEQGLRIFINGVQVAQDATKTEPLNDQISPGQYSFYRNNSGSGDLLASLTGLIDGDMGKAENAGLRRSIERTLMTYGGVVA